MKSLKKNINLFYIVRALFIPFFWLPVLYIYLTQNKGLAPTEAFFLLGLQEFLLIFLEIPTGVIADKISRRFSVALGYVLSSLPFVFLPLVDSYTIMILIFFTKAVGKALISGADSSLLYDTLLDYGQANKFKKNINRARSLTSLVMGICVMLGGIIAEYNIELTLILPFPLMLIGAIAVLIMDEPKTSQKAKTIQEANYLKHIWGSWKFLSSIPILLILVAIYSISEGLGVQLKWIYTPLFEELNFSLALMGAITGGLYFVKSALTFLGTYLMKIEKKKAMIIYSLGVAIAFIIPAIWFNVYTVISALVFVILFNETLNAIQEEELHSLIESKHRATVMSTINMITSIGATVILYSFGFFKENWGLLVSLLLLASFFILSTILAMIYAKKRTTLTI